MRYIKIICFVLNCLFFTSSFAEPNYSEVFKGVEPCFILYNLNKQEFVENYNSERCNKRISPYSTFKIPLSLMGFDKGILKDDDTPKWEYEHGYVDNFDLLKQAQTPKSWIQKSVGWYSQVLANELGMKKIKHYLKIFSYGNQDMRGNKGKNDGLKNAWIGSSLKISANEQIEFLKRMNLYELPVSKYSIDATKSLMFVEDLPNGWQLYGKSGGGYERKADDKLDKDIQEGWFVGWIEKNNQKYLLTLNIQDKHKFDSLAEKRAYQIVQKILNNLDLLK